MLGIPKGPMGPMGISHGNGNSYSSFTGMGMGMWWWEWEGMKITRFPFPMI